MVPLVDLALNLEKKPNDCVLSTSYKLFYVRYLIKLSRISWKASGDGSLRVDGVLTLCL